MQFKHKLIYFALGGAFVVIAQVLLSVVVLKGTAQREKNYSEIFPEQVEQTGKYRISRPTTSTGYEFLLNTETGDCWRMVLYTDIKDAAWVYMPKESPMQWEDWMLKKIQQKQVDQKQGDNEGGRRDTQNFSSSTQQERKGRGKYPKVGGEHWVSEVSKGGRYVILEDKSLWEVAPITQAYAMSWLAKESVTVVENKGLLYPSYPYKLINSDTNTQKRTIRAKYLGVSK